MTRNDRTTLANSRKRRSSGSSASAAKRRRASAASSPDGKHFDKPTRLAIDHMIHDDISHPLYRRNVDQVIDAVATADAERGESTAFPSSLEAAVSIIHSGSPADEAKIKKAERLLLQSWTRKTMQELAAGLASAKYSPLRVEGGNWKFEDVSERYRSELKITPLIDLDDDEEAAAAPSAKERTSAASGKAASKPTKKTSASSNGTSRRSSTNGSASRAAVSQQFATPQDSNDSDSGDERDSSEDGDGTSEGTDYSGKSNESEESDESGSGSDSD